VIKKLLLTVFIVLCTTQVAYSQALLVLLFGDKLSSEKLQAGINFSVSFTDLQGLDESKAASGWAFGMFVELPLSEKWSLQPEFTIKTPAGAKGLADPGSGSPQADSLFESREVSQSGNYLTLPVLLKYKAGKMGFSAGPQIGFLTGATSRFEGRTIDGVDVKLEEDVKSSLNNFDAGVKVGIEYYPYPERKMLTMRIGLNAYFGLTDTIKDNLGDAVKNTGFSLTIGIPVGGKKE
jgi:hypothetical protein